MRLDAEHRANSRSPRVARPEGRDRSSLLCSIATGLKGVDLGKWPTLILSAFILPLLSAAPSQANDDPAHFFESQVRPLLIENCQTCHGEKKQEAGLRLDTLDAALKGGDTGPAIVPGKTAESLLVQAIRYDGDLQMPPKKKLTDSQIATLTRWVESGAIWPSDAAAKTRSTSDAARHHWAFQPIQKPPIPDVESESPRNAIDAFVLRKLNASELTPSPEADRRTLIRRASYAITGLPPSPEEVDAFVNDTDPMAYERLVDRLLDAPQFGEQWARHWLDVARYSDTKGYVYAREERFWVHAWPYRDWVVRAFNEDMPYDRFLRLQIAADQVDDRRPEDFAAMGFLTLGRRFQGVERDIIDDRIDVVTRGTMGLSVACARCHDHKYDPIPTADYYSLYGVFDSCAERLAPLPTSTPNEEFQKELAEKLEKLASTLAKERAATSTRIRERIADHLKAQFELHQYPEEGFDQILAKTDLIPATVRRFQTCLREADRRGDPVFIPWHSYAAIAGDSFATHAVGVTEHLQNDRDRINPLVLAAFTTPPTSMAEVCNRYGKLFTEIDTDWQAAIKGAAAAQASAPAQLPEPAAEQLRAFLYGPTSPCEIPDEPIVHIEYDVDSGTCDELWKLQGDVDRLIINSPAEAPFALTLIDRATPTEPRIFKRGNPANKGNEVPRQFLQLLSGPDRKPFQTGSGRAELAEAIVNPANPLTARVIVNRLWAHHFGDGLVRTPSDFGTRAETPSHPELLDWLATRLVAEGWRLKPIHRLILTSAAFRQSSAGPEDSEQLAKASKIDPANRLLWRMKSRRLSFEELRDSLLAASRQLDRRIGGRPANIFAAPYPKRRTLYGLVDRQFLPGTLRIFDFANPDLHIPQRSETTVPQQALFVMNHPLFLDRARALATAIPENTPTNAALRTLFRNVYQREPTPEQAAAAWSLVREAETVEPPPPPVTAADWSYGYGSFDESVQRVATFTPLPHFSGQAWQGGTSFPDATLGWVQLSAKGGHPGNDRQHAAVRRWTSPRKGTISVKSQLVHEPDVSDGIRSFVVSSRSGLLQSAKVKHQTSDWNLNSLEVEAGETIDFVVDIGDELNSDQYLWSMTIADGAASENNLAWNSEKDFPKDITQQLNGWEQLAQVLLSSNEFLFVD
jgi:mono/diheme cytochrome c family protein